jgi:hypothetical protein
MLPGDSRRHGKSLRLIEEEERAMKEIQRRNGGCASFVRIVDKQ